MRLLSLPPANNTSALHLVWSIVEVHGIHDFIRMVFGLGSSQAHLGKSSKLLSEGFNYEEKYVGMTSEVPFAADKVQELKRNGFSINHSRVRLGSGLNTFNKAKDKLQNWRHLQLGSVSVDPSTQIKVGGKFGIQVHELVAWLVNPLQILYITDTLRDGQVKISPANRGDSSLSEKTSGSSAFAFAGGTLRGHLLAGEERFAVEWNKDDDTVCEYLHRGTLQLGWSLQEKKGDQAELSLRIPSWTIEETSGVNLNGLSLGAPRPGHFFSIKREWKAGDVLQVDLNISLALERIQDDRKHSSLHAILFGPYHLAGMTNGDFEIEAVNTSALSSWIFPIPQSHSAQLYTFSQDWCPTSLPETLKGSEAQIFGVWTSVLSYGSTSASMKSVSKEGTNEAAQATFLLTTLSAGTPEDSLIGRLVYLELYSQPGRVLAHTGVNERLVAVDREARKQSFINFNERSNKESLQVHKRLESAGDTVERTQDEHKVFQVRPGLSGERDTISFEVATIEGSFYGN